MPDVGDEEARLLFFVLLDVALLGELTALEDCLRLNTAAVMSNIICRSVCLQRIREGSVAGCKAGPVLVRIFAGVN